MKFAVKIIMAVVLMVMQIAPVQADALESGFMNMKWSMPAKELKGFTKVGGSKNIEYYVNPQQKYAFFGNESSNQVVYGFYADKFFAVYANIEGIDIFSQIKSYIQNKYGMPDKISRETRGDLTTYSWKIEQTQIKFKHHETTGNMKISLYYLPIAKQANAELKKNLEEEPQEPFIPISPFSDYDGPVPMIEFMRF